MRQSKRSSRRDPWPWIETEICDGCGFCVKACPTRALGLEGGIGVVIAPERCQYYGHCEIVCPCQAIQRPLEIVVAKADEDLNSEG